MTVRRLLSITVVEEVQGMFDPHRTCVKPSLDIGSLLIVGDLVLDEIPQVKEERLSLIVQV